MTTTIQQECFICGRRSRLIFHLDSNKQHFFSFSHLWHYFIQDSKASQAQKLHMIYFVLKFAFNFLVDLRVQIRVCGWKSLSVTGLTKRATKNCNCFLYDACVNLGSVKVSA